MMIAGVDGCRAGWFVALAETWPGNKVPSFAVCPEFRDVLAFTASCKMIVVDMPIGLPSEAEKRKCDLEVRNLLAPEGRSRVFFTPPCTTLDASSYNIFLEKHRQATGRGASRQTYGIVPKLREVDPVMTPELQERVREFHPELAWKRLAGKVLKSKHTENGINDRWSILEKSGAYWVKDLKDRKPPVGTKIDDVLDAFVGLHVAVSITNNTAPRLPKSEIQHDSRGLRMEIWY